MDEITPIIYIFFIISSFSFGVSFALLQQIKSFWLRLDIAEKKVHDQIKEMLSESSKLVSNFEKITKEASKANLSQAEKINSLNNQVLKIEERVNFMTGIGRK